MYTYRWSFYFEIEGRKMNNERNASMKGGGGGRGKGERLKKKKKDRIQHRKGQSEILQMEVESTRGVFLITCDHKHNEGAAYLFALFSVHVRLLTSHCGCGRKTFCVEFK